MNSVLRFLFSSDLAFPGSLEEDAAFGKLSETVQQLSEQLQSVQPELWKTYHEQAEALRDRERQMEFERGFLIAAHLMSAVIGKTPEQ